MCLSPQVLSLLQDGGHSLQHDFVLRHGTARGGDHGSERQQDHLGHDQGAHGRNPLQAQLNEIQGVCFVCVCVCMCLNIIHRIAKFSSPITQSPLLFSVHVVRLMFFVDTGPGEGRRGQDQGRVRPARGGHAKRLPHIGGITSHLSQTFPGSHLRPLHRRITFHLLVFPPNLRAPPVPPFLVSDCVSECAHCHVEGKEKDVLYSLFVASYRRTLDPLRGR